MAKLTSLSDVTRQLTELLGAADVQLDAGAARYTTWRVGGPAALLCVARDAAKLRQAVETARTAG
nr:UDP-N-acetylenolpyruvoylglucosamine reductase [Chloroflexota bacterium]